MKLSQLKPNPKNPRTISEDQMEKLKKSIDSFPKMMPLNPIVYDENHLVLGGNMRLRALKELGFKEIPDDWVKQAIDFTDEEKRQYIIKDNVGFGIWVAEVLQEQYKIEELNEWGLIDVLFPEPEQIKGETDPDDVPGVPVTPKTVKGDLYELGGHRLLCGDSTVLTDIEKLMNGEKADMVFTDPPYGIELDTDEEKLLGKTARSKKYDRIIGDGDAFDCGIIFDFFSDVKEIIIFGADYFIDTLPNFGKDGNFIVWDKRVTGHEDKKNYASEFELCWSKQKRARIIYKHDWVRFFGMQKEDTKKRLHPNQKPTKLLIDIMPEGERVVDLFTGSGSMIISCEKTDRKCYGMELDEKYVDVCVTRWLDFAGETEFKLNGKKITREEWES